MLRLVRKLRAVTNLSVILSHPLLTFNQQKKKPSDLNRKKKKVKKLEQENEGG